MLEQGKGTEHDLLPLGDWLSVAIGLYHPMTVITDHSPTILPLILKGFQVDHEHVHQKDVNIRTNAIQQDLKGIQTNISKEADLYRTFNCQHLV